MAASDDLHHYHRKIKKGKSFSAKEVQDLMNYYDNKLMVLIEEIKKTQSGDVPAGHWKYEKREV